MNLGGREGSAIAVEPPSCHSKRVLGMRWEAANE